MRRFVIGMLVVLAIMVAAVPAFAENGSIVPPWSVKMSGVKARAGNGTIVPLENGSIVVPW